MHLPAPRTLTAIRGDAGNRHGLFKAPEPPTHVVPPNPPLARAVTIVAIMAPLGLCGAGHYKQAEEQERPHGWQPVGVCREWVKTGRLRAAGNWAIDK